MKIELVEMDKSFLELTWNWLNDIEIKRLTNAPSFSKIQQENWFNSLKERHDYKIWGIDADQVHIGVCGLKNITDIDCEYWGYIGEKEFWGRGIGSIILSKLISYSKNQNLFSMWLNVNSFNQRAINLYTKFGFIHESRDESNVIKMRLIL